MKKRLYSLLILFLVSYCSFSQGVGVGTTTPDASAALDISAANKGLLIPRMSLASINAIINPARGLMAYDSVANQLMVNIGTTVAPNWQAISGNGGGGGWSLTGNSGTNPANQFIGTTDNQPLRFRINNIQAGELNTVNANSALGFQSLLSNTTGFSNTAIGALSLTSNSIGNSNTAVGTSSLFSNTTGGGNAAFGNGSLRKNTTGSSNTAVGNQSLLSNATGNSNTAVGDESLALNTTGNSNTAVGGSSLFLNTTGIANTAIGFESLLRNTTGNNNTALGHSSLSFNSTGNGNVAVGVTSLFANTTGLQNTAIGFESLKSNTAASNNTAYGFASLRSNTTGSINTAVGAAALLLNTTGFANTGVGLNAIRDNTVGNNNTALGQDALLVNTGNFNVAIGSESMKSTAFSENNTVVGFGAGSAFALGFNNTLIGANADMFSGDLFNCVAIGNNARCGSSNQIRFGNSFTTSIGGVVGFTNLSDGRYKKNIQESVKGIDFIMKLRPVTYQLDVSGISRKLKENNGKEMDDLSKKTMAEQEKTVFSGFVAQEVEQAAKTVGYDFSGVDKPKNENDMYGLRYADFVVPLVKAVQEQQQLIAELKKQNEAMKKSNTDQKTLNENLLKRIEKLESPLTGKK